MKHQEKLQEIIRWYKEVSPDEVRSLASQQDFERITAIEALTGEELPTAIRELFQQFDGEEGDGYGAFMGHELISLDKMRDSLVFSESLIKPASPHIANPEKSQELLDQIIRLVVSDIPNKKKFGFIRQKWHMIVFQTGPDSFGGPYLYRSPETSDLEREIVRLSDNTLDKVSELTQTLHNLERADYNWDELKITAFADGQSEVERSFYNFDEELALTSTPPDVIKKKYFHIKWIPLISDFGGNYIGIDLDPDTQGTKGQVILFGRDDEDMVLLAHSWDEFLDWNLELIKTDGDNLKDADHLHDYYKELKAAK